MVIYVLWVFLVKIKVDGGECFTCELVITVLSLMMMCFRSSKAKAFSFDTR